jgi:hypothetical protein
MTITTTILYQDNTGLRRVIGKSVLSGTASTGDVATGLNQVLAFHCIPYSSTPIYMSVDEVLPLASGDVSVKVSGNDATFYWEAIGN